ncbi:cellulose binding domain-containing protein, partial [Streptomyces sp. P01-B04]
DPTPTPTPTPDPTDTPGPAGSCAVTYRVSQSWGSGFTADVSVRNTGTDPVDGWQLGFAFGGAETVTNAWNASASQTGSRVTVKNATHNAGIPAGGTVSFGFQATGAPAQAPSSFTLNGTECG